MRRLKVSLIILSFAIVYSCGNREARNGQMFKLFAKEDIATPVIVDNSFLQYISGYTSGVVPANSQIEIRLTPEFAAMANKSATGLFSFSPKIAGKTEWKNETTLVFSPNNPLDAGTVYTGSFNLGKLYDLEKRLQSFPLKIQTLQKDFRVTTGVLECDPENAGQYLLHGELTTTDFIAAAETESYLKAKMSRTNLEIGWDHSERLNHKFVVKGIKRAAEKQSLELSWNGSSGGVKQKGAVSISIPEAGLFNFLNVIKYQGQNPKIDVIFTDPIDPEQDLIGLIYFESGKESKISVNSNIVTLYPVNILSGEETLFIQSTVRSKNGQTLPQGFSHDLDFTQQPPQIKFEGKGVIIPTSDNLILPFSAINVNAVDIRIVKIYENNLPYFLQETNINQGTYSMKRFGNVVFTGKVNLVTGSDEAGNWNLHTVNLADYIKVEPGVLYRVTLSMRKSYSLFPCEGDAAISEYEKRLDESQEDIKASWYDPDNYYEDIYYYQGFNWRDREDPCKDAYYSPDKAISKNILASNLGLMAKKGADNNLNVFVSDIVSALPIKDAKFEVYDYQMQSIGSGVSNVEGYAQIACDRKPFLLIAFKGNDRNYLKLNDGSSLSLSSFDISGASPQKGIKAFVYGERDVWRPGDSIFLSVFIKNMLKELPPSHPVQFELINPQGQKVDNQIKNTEGMNLISFAAKTSPDAITGSYQANFKIGGATFSKRIRVETIKPNRLKINLDFGDSLLRASKATRGSLNVKWLNGAVAGNLDASIEYMLKKAKTEFKGYSQYSFDDPVNEFQSETVHLFNDKIDAAGNASFTFNPTGNSQAPGMLNAVFTARVAEKGGDVSITQKTYPYAPYKVFAGIELPGLNGKNRMLFTDNENVINIVTVDESGKPVSSRVEVNIYKISYKWWWESQDEDLGYYISSRHYKPCFEQTVNTNGGKGSVKFKIDKKEWGRYLIRITTPEGHSAGKITLIDWPWEYGLKNQGQGATLLSVNVDKEKYNPGQEVKLSFPSPENAQAIITLENATGVLQRMRVNTNKGTTEVKFNATPEMAPNVYAYVSVIQPHVQTVNDMPMRLYGITPIMVEDPKSRLEPQIEVNNELRSGKPFTVKVSEKSKQAMSYTIAIVDEGLLDITGFKTPDPWRHFFAREALGVMTWDLYDFVFGAYGGILESLFAVGGDEALVDKSLGKAQRFVPVVKFLGPFQLQSGKTNQHTVVLPQYTGSVRAMVVAGNDNAFGFAEKSSFVRDPLMLLGTAPRTVSPGDKVSLPVTLFVQKESIKEITLRAKSNDLIKFNERTKTIKVTDQEIDSELSFTAGEKTGIAKITLTAEGDGETAVYSIELDVRSPNPPETRTELKVINPGEKWEPTFDQFGIEGTNAANLTISSLPSIDLAKHIEYLVGYPHGCSEQIVSKAFPQLFIRKIIGDDSQHAKTASSNVTSVIERIMQRQMNNGGIALWPNSSQPDNWVTSYAGHFMIEAERLGYSVSSGFKRNWVSFQQAKAREWRHDAKFQYSANDQAYRLFTLALAGEPERSAMNRLREVQDIPQISRWLLAAAYAATGRNEISESLLDVRNTSSESEYYDYYYGSEIRDKSIILYALTLLNKKEESLLLAKELADKMNSGSWYSTQALSWGLFSYMKWAETVAPSSTAVNSVKTTINGETGVQSIPSGKIWSKDLDVKRSGNKVAVENTSGGSVYATLTLTGIPVVAAPPPTGRGLSMTSAYYDNNMSPINCSLLKQGTDFMMVIKVTNTSFSNVDNIALTTMMPSGWEIQNTRLYETVSSVKESAFEYRDFRDDRIYTYFSLKSGETKTFTFLLNAAYKGTYNQPSIWCEAMYKSGYTAGIQGGSVTIEEQRFE